MEQPTPAGRRIAFFGGSFDPPHQGHLAVARAARDALALDTVLFAPVGAQPLKPGGSTAGFRDRVAMTRLAIDDEPGLAVSLIDAPRPSAAPNYTAPNYTIDTLLELRAQLPPGGTLFCLMGADSFFSLRRWHRSAEIPFAAALIVASRPGQPLDDLRSALPPGLTMEPAPPVSNFTRESSGSSSGLLRYILSNPAAQSAALYLLPGLNVEISASQIRGQIVREQISSLACEQIQSATEPSTSGSDLISAPVLDYIRSHRLYG
jgi:nicotinate-nucleotide adenylyltransferase